MQDVADELAFFEKMPQMLPVYEKLEACLFERYPQMRIQVQKTQISFYNKHLFACVSLPRKKKGIPPVCCVVTFGLGWQVQSPRIGAAVEPYPNRWTHHVFVESPQQIDDQLLAWLDMAYQFGMQK